MKGNIRSRDGYYINFSRL